MRNLVTYELIGEEFMNYLASLSPQEADAVGFNLIEKSMFDGLKLYRYDKELLLKLIGANAKEVSYVSRVLDGYTRYITEDSCHNIRGYRYLNDLNDSSNVKLVLRKLGGQILNFYEDPENDSMHPLFLDRLAPVVMHKLVTMTCEYMNGETDNVDLDIIRAIWGNEDNQSIAEWLVSLEDIMESATWGDEEVNAPFKNYLIENVLNVAEYHCVNVEKPLPGWTMSDVRHYVASLTWDKIIKIWCGDATLINEVRMECGIEEFINEKPTKNMEKEFMLGREWYVIDQNPLKETDSDGEPIWWKVIDLPDGGELWEENVGGRIFLLTKEGKMYTSCI